MPFFLVCSDLHLTVKLMFTADAKGRMRQQLIRLQDQGNLAALGGKLARELAREFPELIHWDLNGPMPAQLALARFLSTALNGHTSSRKRIAM